MVSVELPFRVQIPLEAATEALLLEEKFPFRLNDSKHRRRQRTISWRIPEQLGICDRRV